MAVVVDLVPHPNGTIVHLDVLPSSTDEYLDWQDGLMPQPDAVPRPVGSVKAGPPGIGLWRSGTRVRRLKQIR